MQPVILITRPEPEASRLADEVRRRWPGLRVVVSPLQEIEVLPLPAPDPSSILIFTSRNGVRAWVASGHAAGGRAFCVGDATAEAAREAGMTAWSAGGSVTDLLALIRESAPQGPLCHVRGENHRGNLVHELELAGFSAHGVTGYRQVPRLPGAEMLQLMSGAAPVIAPLYSPQSARLFATAWAGGARLFVAAISPAIAPIVEPLRPYALETAAQANGGSMLVALAGLVLASHQLEAGRGGV